MYMNYVEIKPGRKQFGLDDRFMPSCEPALVNHMPSAKQLAFEELNSCAAHIPRVPKCLPPD